MDDTDKYKMQLSDTLAPLISKEGLTDVTDWIIKNAKEGYNHNGVARSVAYILEAKGDFKVEKLQDESRFYVKRLPKRSLEQKQPTLFKLGLILLGSGLTMLGSIQSKNKSPQLIYITDTSRIYQLHDSVATIRHDLGNLQDTVAKYIVR